MQQRGSLRVTGGASDPGPLTAAARFLATQVRDRCRRESSDGAPDTPVRPKWILDRDRSCGASVTELTGGATEALYAQVYSPLVHDRLVILGERGAGKTETMRHLQWQALNERGPADPVPVWVTLGGWKPDREPLLAWVATRMERDFPALRNHHAYGRGAAIRLVAHHRIALFLDGLDELAAADQALALAVIDRDTTGMRWVLSARPNSYPAASAGGGPRDSAVVRLLPVEGEAVADFLGRSRDDVAEGPQLDRLAAQVLAHPDGLLARTLGNPATLSLVPVAFSGTGDPPDLAALDSEAEIRAALIDRFLRTAYPHPEDQEYATRWLSWIAHHLEDSPGPARDVVWWRFPRWVSRGRRGLVAGVGLGVVSWLVVRVTSDWRIGSFCALSVGIAVALVIALTAGPGRQPTAWAPRLPRVGELGRILVVGLGGGAAIGVAAGLVVSTLFVLWSMLLFGPVGGLVYAITGGPLGGPVLGLLVGAVVGPVLGLLALWGRPTAQAPAATPRDSYRRSRRAGLLTGLVGGPAIGAVVGLLFWLLLGPLRGVVSALYLGLEASGEPPGVVPVLTWAVAAGTTGGVLSGLAVGAAPRLRVAEAALRTDLRSRVRFIPLLEESHKQGVLRQIGPIYQFRDVELQRHLAARYREARLWRVGRP